ncbi:MAG TPA: AMP-binding protein [Acidiphilium sp.]|jgi:long-chain acyl-CoA synthetase|uniref:class I adenylate-forming enzyme family protein n=1 Tax=unclassified Acidiphilium TaxID=2617493 RepID=UPI000BC71CFB|nr:MULTISPECIES: AMP-binding protein [unclassified Acidiphilium]OYV55974.1 MAG: acyl-CoA synthetase [Acidiphilium sp. 20-67-58]OYV87151.1 MAG: acyl-CoA synthetase [Acidiphilium sp. 21-68-69]HQT61547.1 AMP-binding protein [Acidiphilium sp.]HQU09977.1 AMP-binding protein [Acidiphilium sp.]
MSIYDEKPWLALYDAGQPAEIAPDFTDALAMFRAAVARAPQAPAILYFDGRISYAELDRLSDGLAGYLAAHGFGAGDRLAVYLQNVPQFVIAILGAWKAGGIAVAVNPMNRAREIGILFADCTPKAVVCHDTTCDETVGALEPGLRPQIVLTTSALAFQTRNDKRVFAGMQRVACAGAVDFETAIGAGGALPPTPACKPDDIAFLVYTSGTTGVPKGAMNTHGNVTFNAQTYRDWIGLGEGAPILGIAPLFHITGLIGHIAAAFITASPLILAYRFEPGVMLDAIEEHKAAFTIGAITAFIAMMNHPDAAPAKLASMTRIYSGGAPIPPSVVTAFRETFGHYIHNGYGLTETNSPTHVVPLSREAPVDPASGALSIGVPAYNTISWICDDEGRELPVGEVGEIVSQGPMIVPGYWNKPDKTAEAIRNGRFHTGDVGFMDKDGWFYLVDRKKDMINAAGYKVWPREVEDVLYTHPAVREAAVVGIADAYRGETVKAVISLRPGTQVTQEEIVAFCKERMAAYKYPRLVEIIDDLPKTVTGKILRRELRG